MPDKLPSLEELLVLPPNLRKDYLTVSAKSKNKKTDPQRLEFLDFYTRLAKKVCVCLKDKKLAQDILRGALIYELEYIKAIDYKGCSPEKAVGWYSVFTAGRGSDLYTIIKRNVLKINKQNRVLNDKRLNYLNALYHFVDEHMPEDKKLLEKIYPRLIAVLKREYDRIKDIAEGFPELNALDKHIFELPEKYKKDSSPDHDPERDVQLALIKFIAATCEDKYGTNPDEFLNNINYMRSSNVKFGVLLLIAMHINYGHWILSPKGGIFNNGSVLFKAILKILVVKDLSKIEREKKIEWLRELKEHIISLENTHQFPEKFQAYKEKLNEYIDLQEQKKHAPSWYRSIADSVVRYGVGLAATRLTADVALKWIGSALAVGVSGPIGFVVYLTGGTILVSQLGKLVSEKVIDKTSSYLYSWTLDKMSKSITHAANETVIVRFHIPKQGGIRAILNDPNVSDKCKQEIVDWYNTLLTLPRNNIVTEEDKNIIRDNCGPETLKKVYVNENKKLEEDFTIIEDMPKTKSARMA